MTEQTQQNNVAETGYRLCEVCGLSFKGRSDKRFCSDACRNANKRQLQRISGWQEPAFVEKIHRMLRHNRQILRERLNQETKLIISKTDLIEAGFHFGYCTSVFSKEMNIYRFCYEYGWLEVENGKILLVKNERQIDL
ncbi:hypothetical protein ACTJKC_02765 [Pedobacter sp. 22226]|uniref:hypothetical protein n=1 Tax=Pedobacter sp. 22226 TaxID=3453894 RepID=UPI003F86F508